MDPITDTIIDKGTSRARLGLLLKHFSKLGDDREPLAGHVSAQGGPAVGDLRHDRFLRRLR